MSVIADTTSRIDPGVRHLNGPVETLGISCCKRINCDHNIRFCLLHDSVHDLHRFHTCLCHHTRNNTAHAIDMLFSKRIFSVFIDNMSRNVEIIHHSWSQCIRRYCPVSKPDDQYGDILFFYADQLL